MSSILKSILSRKSLNYKTNFSGDRKKLDYFNETGRRKMIFVKEIILIITSKS